MDVALSSVTEQFKQRGYAIIRDLVDKTEIERLYTHTLKIAPLGNFNDGQVPGSSSFYQDPEMVQLHKSLSPRLAELVQLKLHPTFCFNRVYRTGAVLRAHKDRRACEVAVTLNLGQQGPVWDLWLLDYDENVQKIVLGPGDGLIYHGQLLTHWRGKLVAADFVSQVLLFFVVYKGKHTFAYKAELITRFLAYGESRLLATWSTTWSAVKKAFSSIVTIQHK